MTEEFEKISDMEIALQWAFYIQNPCGTEINGQRFNIRDFYLRESREHVLPRLTNPYAIDFLQSVIDRYR